MRVAFRRVLLVWCKVTVRRRRPHCGTTAVVCAVWLRSTLLIVIVGGVQCRARVVLASVMATRSVLIVQCIGVRSCGAVYLYV
jgi:hypothetical protein